MLVTVNLDKLRDNINISSDSIARLFSIIAESSRRGNHIYFLPFEDVEWIRKRVSLSKPDDKQLERLGRKSFRIKPLIKEAVTLLNIEICEEEIFNFDGKIWTVGHRVILENAFLEKPKLLVENAHNDGEFYRIIFKHGAKRFSINRIDFEPAMGGGTSTMLNEFDRLLDESPKRIVICICDQDSILPLDEECADDIEKHEIIGKLIELSNDSSESINLVKFTPGYSIENFIPHSIIYSLRNQYKREWINEINVLMENNSEKMASDCFWLRLNLKNGLKVSELKEPAKSDIELRKWIIRKFRIKESEYDNLHVHAFGSNIVRDFLASDIEPTEFEEFVNSDFWKVHFDEWVNSIAWYICCDQINPV